MSNLDKEFQSLLIKISNELSKEDLKRMKFYLESFSKIPKRDLQDGVSGEDVFSLMKKHGYLSTTNTDELLNILKLLKLAKCIEMLKSFNRDNQEIVAKAREGPCNIKEDMVVEHFMETSKLKELEERMRTENFITFSGLLGSGKSQLALRYACKFRSESKDGVCWRISCQEKIILLNSLKKLADELGLKDQSRQSEVISNEESQGQILELILHEMRLMDVSIQHLFVFDDVTTETEHAVEKMKNSILKLNTKIIATTWISSFCDEENTISVNGFSLDESVEFLKKKSRISSEEEAAYKKLAEHLSCLPLAMYGVKARMKANKLTPEGFLKSFKGKKSLSMIDKYVSSSENRKLFEVLVQFLDMLKKDEVEDVFDMILILQFLSVEDIPILLFQFLPKVKEDTDQRLNKESFIEAIQKFSFGQLRGEDDNRFIGTHAAVIKAIDFYTTSEEKCRLLRKVLKALMWLLDKDNIHDKDYKRNSDLLPHAISVLSHYDKLKSEVTNLCSDFEMNVLLAYVYDLVGYTYNFFGMMKNAGEHSTAARSKCFELIGIPEEEIEEMVSKSCQREENSFTCEEFAKIEAMLMFEGLQKRASENIELLQKLALDFILNKYRGQEHIDLLQGYLGADLNEEYTLTRAEYDQLCEKKLAVPIENHQNELFLYELILQILYTFGRRVFYLGESIEKDVSRKFSYSLFLARALGDLISKECQKWEHPKLLYVMLTELSGTLEQIFDDRGALQLRTLENLEHAAARFKELQESEDTYFIWGIIKSGPDSYQHRKICYKRLVRCYTAMAECTTDEEKIKEIKEKIKFYRTKLEELSSQWGYRQTGADLRMAQCSLILEDYEDSEVKFRKVAPSDMLDDTEERGQSKLNFHQMLAIKGLIKCFKGSGKEEEAKHLAERLKMRLEATREFEELSHFNEISVHLLGLSSLT